MISKRKSFFLYAFLTVTSLISVFPLLWMVIAATNKSIDVVKGRMLPGMNLAENFRNLLAAQDAGTAMFNSFKYAIVLTAVSLVICSLAGYGFEIFHDRAKDTVMSIILLAMMVCSYDDTAVSDVFQCQSVKLHAGIYPADGVDAVFNYDVPPECEKLSA